MEQRIQIRSLNTTLGFISVSIFCALEISKKIFVYKTRGLSAKFQGKYMDVAQAYPVKKIHLKVTGFYTKMYITTK